MLLARFVAMAWSGVVYGSRTTLTLLTGRADGKQGRGQQQFCSCDLVFLIYTANMSLMHVI